MRTDLGKKRFDCRSSKWLKHFAQKCKFGTIFFSTLDFIGKNHSFQFLAVPSLLEYDKPLYFFFLLFLGFRPPPAKSKSTAQNIWIFHMFFSVDFDLAGGRVGPRTKEKLPYLIIFVHHIMLYISYFIIFSNLRA